MKSAVIYYTDGRLDSEMEKVCVQQLINVVPISMPLISIMQHRRAKRSLLQMFINILCGIAQTDADYIFLAEHDVLYPEAYFDIAEDAAETPFCFHVNGYFLDDKGFTRRYGNPLSVLSGQRESMIKFLTAQLRRKLNKERCKYCEPQKEEYEISYRTTQHPYIDIRHGQNYTGGREPARRHKQRIEYWPEASTLWKLMKGTS